VGRRTAAGLLAEINSRATSVGDASVPESIELATILVTDLVGSTRLANSVGPVRADELRDEHFDVLREAVGASGGREFRSTGDGMMVAFSSALLYGPSRDGSAF